MMVKLTKKRIKDNERIRAWRDGVGFKENGRAKSLIPLLTPEQVMEQYTPDQLSEAGKFYTPLPMAKAFWGHAIQNKFIDFKSNIKLLDPCAGLGNLIDYPAYNQRHWSIFAYDIDEEAVSIGRKLFPLVKWHSYSPFFTPSNYIDVFGYFDLVVMNPPINTGMGIADALNWAKTINSKATRIEHIFLQLAINALKKGGYLLMLAPETFINKLPKGKGVMDWFTENAEVRGFYDLPGEFQHTKVKLWGWVIQRISETEPGDALIDFEDWQDAPDEPIMTADIDVGPPNTIEELPDEPEEIIENLKENIQESGEIVQRVTKTLNEENVQENQGKEAEKQLTLSLLPDTPPNPVFAGNLSIQDMLEKLVPHLPGKPLTPAFVRSIKRWGVRDPIEINEMPDGKNHLMAGRRRLAAAIEIGLEKIPVKIYKIDSLNEATFIIDSNAQRSDNPISDYQAITAIMKQAEDQSVIITEKDISHATGLSIPKIRKRLRLAEIHPDFIIGVSEKQIALGTAEAVADLSADQQEIILRMLHRNGKVTGKNIGGVKRTKKAQTVSQIPAEIFNTPGFDPAAHVHDFLFSKDQDVVFCEGGCGRSFSTSEMLGFLNRMVD